MKIQGEQVEKSMNLFSNFWGSKEKNSSNINDNTCLNTPTWVLIHGK
jgi:hypothetical protein